MKTKLMRSLGKLTAALAGVAVSMGTLAGAAVSIGTLAVVVGGAFLGCAGARTSGRLESGDGFEIVRARVQTWLAGTSEDRLLMPAPRLKRWIVDDWPRQSSRYEIVCLGKREDYLRAGHIPNAVNIPWIETVADSSLDRLDRDKTLVLYCYYGHASMISGTILGLLGYRCCSLEFGMMGWNLDALVKEPWDQQADQAIELTANRPESVYALPVISAQGRDAAAILRERAEAYFSGEGSPVIASADLAAILDDWSAQSSKYQILDVRSPDAYAAGHVPHAIHLPWRRLADVRLLRGVDPNRTAVVCSENGQTGQLAATVLNLLGYPAVAMKFGMMDWNRRFVNPQRLWTGAAGYPVECAPSP